LRCRSMSPSVTAARQERPYQPAPIISFEKLPQYYRLRF
jgi:hypothetical protein